MTELIAIARRWIAEQLAYAGGPPPLERDLLLLCDELLEQFGPCYSMESMLAVRMVLARLAPHCAELAAAMQAEVRE